MFEKITPEQAGVSSRRVAEFISYLRRRGVVMHSILLMKGNNIFAEYYYKPFHKDFCHRMYSQTKSYVGVAIGLLEEEGKLDLDTPITELFPEKTDTEPFEFLKEQTVRHMLTMETAVNSHNWFTRTGEDKDRTHMYLNDGPRHGYRAGMFFEYDSPGSQVLGALVEKLSGMSLLDYLKSKLFDYMGTFKTATVLKTPNGDSWGDSALVCTPRDMASFARFVMNYGTWNGKRLMNENYLRTATSKLVDNNLEGFVSDNNRGYGYQIWKTEQNGFAFLGMGCQNTICLPSKDLIMVVTGDNQGNSHARSQITNGFFDYIANNAQPAALPEDKEAQDLLKKETADLKLYYVDGIKDTAFRKEVSGVKYICDDENPMGISEFTLNFSSDGSKGEFVYTNAQGKKTLPFGICENVFCKFPQLGYSNEVGGMRTTDGFMYDTAVSAAWLEEQKLMIKVQIIDRYFGNFCIVFSFKDDFAAVRMKKTAEDFLDEYNGWMTARKA